MTFISTESGFVTKINSRQKKCKIILCDSQSSVQHQAKGTLTFLNANIYMTKTNESIIIKALHSFDCS